MMWVFYLISLPLTLGMVIFPLRYFAGPDVPRYVLFTVGYTWLSSLSIIVLVPADIWATISSNHETAGISFFWSWSYWSTFLLTWAAAPLIQGFEDAGDFTVSERLKTSLHVNLIFYLILGSIGLIGLIILIMMRKAWTGSLLGLAMALSNTFGLVTGAFLLGFGLSEIPKSIWRNADQTTRQKVLTHKIAKMAVKLDNAHQELSNAIVVAQATSNLISKRDPLRPFMDVVDDMLTRMFREDPSFKPQGGQFGESDMDYDTDEKSMATLRRHLRGAAEEYYRYRSEYMTYVLEALELEDTIKNYERRTSTGWKYISSIRPDRTGKLGSLFDTSEFFWRCILRKQVQKGLAIILGLMSVAILLAEATLLPSVDLSLFSILIKSFGTQEMLVQVFALVPLMYMCVCTYYSLFKIGRLTFYTLTPRQTSSVNLLMICSMVARYAPPISYNFLNLIRLGSDKTTIFEQRMGNIDKAVPFFGDKFNRIYPLIMVIYTILVASNFFDRVFDFLGSWKRYIFKTDAEDMDGFDPSGLIILQKERYWIEQGHKVGEQVVPLARNFYSVDVESANYPMEKNGVEVDRTSHSSNAEISRSVPKTAYKEETRRYSSNREVISSKYAAVRQQSRQAYKSKPDETNIASAKVSLLHQINEHSGNTSEVSSSGLSSTWKTMKTGFQSFKANIGAKKGYLPLPQTQEDKISRASSSESLDDIFQRMKQPSLDQGRSIYNEDD
ncbi:PREDICTED: LMBR1 domain-containing protein 2 homolog A-like isoform X1 [Lupinus angustifolius]|uniref:LMBR1 domain-containing protein 2 homolog A-like isoform X1 n=1 Tax=Lupinus angustifolius TaxID=3871 RepID=UPI00092FD99A|nr:PREDICTED: LMBR1 domain-containing protein 2 homolog A-like isoform X1 [Lupinus angustifolius]